MQREEKIPISSLATIVAAVYDGAPRVFEAYSRYECDIRDFPSKESLEKLIADEFGNRNRYKYVYCFLLYPGTNGFVRKRRVELDPKHCNGATYRYAMEGWGLIHFQLDLTDRENISCRVAVNSEKRANNWSETYPELGSPSLWDWSVIEKHSRRLIRVLRKIAKPPPADTAI